MVHFNIRAKYPFHNSLHLKLIQLTSKEASTCIKYIGAQIVFITKNIQWNEK